MADLPEPLKAHKTLNKFADKAGLAQSYVELESKLGKSVSIPANDASREEWAKFYERVGRPKSADDYAIDRAGASDESVKAFKQWAFEANLTSAQADVLYKKYVGDQKASQQAAVEQITTRAKEADALLRRKHGAQYDTVIAQAKKAYTAIFDETLRAEITNAGLGANPRFIETLAAIGQQINGDNFLQGAGQEAKPKDPYAWMNEKYGSAK